MHLDTSPTSSEGFYFPPLVNSTSRDRRPRVPALPPQTTHQSSINQSINQKPSSQSINQSIKVPHFHPKVIDFKENHSFYLPHWGDEINCKSARSEFYHPPFVSQVIDFLKETVHFAHHTGGRDKVQTCAPGILPPSIRLPNSSISYGKQYISLTILGSRAKCKSAHPEF